MDKIRKGDDVIVITGKDKGKRGVVLQRVDAERLVV
ncbi:MAG: KOW motif-containing protein, partial [Rhodocyclales bacterium]|nr:KOW motif-containing protein [Rhodocyclales bacterium]